MVEIIKIFGDKYRLRKTYDINEFGVGIYGYEIYNDNSKKFLCYVGGIEKIRELKNYIKTFFYKSINGLF